MTSYAQFLAGKRLVAQSSGIEVPAESIHPRLFPFQGALTRWALRKGRAALLADTGLGKTVCQLEWARHTGERTLILTPLSVARQTEAEAQTIGLPTRYVRSQEQVEAAPEQVIITNYEMIQHFDPSRFGAVVLDESSILKGLDGKTRKLLTEMFAGTRWRLCCTATPAPNDIAEIAHHAEFLGVMSRAEMLAAFFVHDDKGWRLKGHASEAFYRWMASWGMFVRRPSDIGYSDEGYILPPLRIEQHVVQADLTPTDRLFYVGLKGIQERSSVRKASLGPRCERAAELIQGDPQAWIAWAGLNDEGRRLHRLLPGSALMEGADRPDKKLADIHGFQDGQVPTLITKPTIAGFGLNLQCCARQVFVGIGDSYEQYYQCIRRSYRFRQTRPVEAHIVVSEPEQEILENVLRKEREAREMAEQLIAHVGEFEREEIGEVTAHDTYRAEMPMGLPDGLETAA